MKITYKEILDAVPAITGLSKVDMPGGLALRVARGARLIMTEAKTFEDLRLDTARALGTPAADGKTIDFPDKGEAFTSKMSEMLAEKIELDLPRLDAEDLAKLPQVSPALLIPLFGIMIDV